MVSTINATSASGIVSTADNSTTLALQTNGTTAVYVDASQNVGIGTTSPGYKLDVQGSSSGAFSVNFQNTNSGSSAQARATFTSTSNTLIVGSTNDTALGGGGFLYNGSVVPLTFFTNATERMRIDSSGQIWVGYTSQIFSASGYKVGITFDGSSQQGMVIKNTVNSSPGAAIRFVDYLGNYSGGGIYFSSSNSISYATSSDYRLKDNVKPLKNGIETISALAPVSYTWKVDGKYGEGFIAHDLQAVIPNAVTGEKDAVNQDGSINAQGVDYSKIVVHLVAAIQELSAKVDAQAAEIAALKAKGGA